MVLEFLFVFLKRSQLLSWQWQYAFPALLASVHGSSTLSLTRPTQLLCFRRQRRNAFPALFAADAPLTDTGSRAPHSFSASGGSGDMRSLRCSCCCWRRQWRPWPVRSTCKTSLYYAALNFRLSAVWSPRQNLANASLRSRSHREICRGPQKSSSSAVCLRYAHSHAYVTPVAQPRGAAACSRTHSGDAAGRTWRPASSACC